MKLLVGLLICVGLVSCNKDSENKNGGERTKLLIAEEIVKPDDKRLESLCKLAGKTSNFIDDRIVAKLEYKSSVNIVLSGKGMTGKGSGTSSMSAVERTDNLLKVKTTTTAHLTLGTDSKDMFSERNVTKECRGEGVARYCSTGTQSKGDQSFPVEMFSAAKLQSISIGKYKINGVEHDAVRRIYAGTLPSTIDGKSSSIDISLDLVSIPDFPLLDDQGRYFSLDCGTDVLSNMTFSEPAEGVTVNVSSNLDSVVNLESAVK